MRSCKQVLLAIIADLEEIEKFTKTVLNSFHWVFFRTLHRAILYKLSEFLSNGSAPRPWCFLFSQFILVHASTWDEDNVSWQRSLFLVLRTSRLRGMSGSGDLNATTFVARNLVSVSNDTSENDFELTHTSSKINDVYIATDQEHC